MTSRIEETWRLWSKFLDDYSRFEEWLKVAEITAGNPDSSNVLYTGAKEELKKFEVSEVSLFYSSPTWLCVCLETAAPAAACDDKVLGHELHCNTTHQHWPQGQ